MSVDRCHSQQRWMIEIQEAVLEGHVEHRYSDHRPVSIFSVPQQLFLIKPEAFIPQEVSIGPYHHLKPELNEMERFKISSARRAHKSFPGFRIHAAVEKLAKHEHRIRSCYHRYLESSRDALLWMMALDSCFLLEYLQFFAIKPLERSPSKVEASARSNLIDYIGKKAAQQYILRDIMMLENQIPLFVLTLMSEMQFDSSMEANRRLKTMIIGLCVELSPFKMVNRTQIISDIEMSEMRHLLEVLYHIIILPPEIVPETIDDFEMESGCESDKHEKRPTACLKLFPAGTLPTARELKEQSLEVFSPETLVDKGCIHIEGGGEQNYVRTNAPLVEEIMIPTVEELREAGMNFCATNGRITSIEFDQKTSTLFLPSITLDAHTEVITRNLVAYEAVTAPGALIFARYIELMNGIIDTEEDVRILRESGILFNHLKSDHEAAHLFNSMSKSVRLTRVEFLDGVIQAVNKYYASRWTVKGAKFVRKSVFGSWKVLTFLATGLLLLMTFIQTVCSVYDCSAWLGSSNIGGRRLHRSALLG